MTRLLLADDHPFVMSGIEAVLRDKGFTIVDKVGNGAAALESLARTRPEILLLDVQMPERDGMHVLRTLRGRGDLRPIVLLTASLDDQRLVEAIELGVNGIVLKEGAQSQLVDCLNSVRVGGRWIDQGLLQRALDLKMQGTSDPLAPLSKRERTMVGLITQSLRNKEIAAELGMSEGTVKVYLHRIYEKLGVSSRTELAMFAKDAASN